MRVDTPRPLGKLSVSLILYQGGSSTTIRLYVINRIICLCGKISHFYQNKQIMKYFTRERIVRFVTYNRITKFVAKLFGMISKFKNGEYVQLKFNNRYKFYVVSNVIVEGKIQLGYFSEETHCIEEDAYIEPSKLEYSAEELMRRYKELNHRADLEDSL